MQIYRSLRSQSHFMKAIETLCSSIQIHSLTTRGHAKLMFKCPRNSRCSKIRWRLSHPTSTLEQLFPTICTTQLIPRKSNPQSLKILFHRRSIHQGKCHFQKERTFGDLHWTMETTSQPQLPIRTWSQRSNLLILFSSNLYSNRWWTKCSKTPSTMSAIGMLAGRLDMTSM